jgi:hypothetical protein
MMVPLTMAVAIQGPRPRGNWLAEGDVDVLMEESSG